MEDRIKQCIAMLREGACCSVCVNAFPSVDWPYPCEERTATNDNMDEAANIIESLVAQLEAAQPKWISVEEPPKHTCDYLVYVWVAYPDGIAHMQMRTGIYNIVRKEWTIPHDQSEVVGEPEYWMPFPTPPKEDV